MHRYLNDDCCDKSKERKQRLSSKHALLELADPFFPDGTWQYDKCALVVKGLLGVYFDVCFEIIQHQVEFSFASQVVHICISVFILKAHKPPK